MTKSSTAERDRELFNNIAKNYALKDMVKSSALPRKYQLLFALEPLLQQTKKIGTILEIGCGVAAPAKHLDGYYHKFIGTDYSEEMVKAAKVFHDGNPKVEFLVDDITKTRLPKHSADLILSLGVLHHISDLDQALVSILRLGKPGGAFVAIEPQRGNPIIQALRFLRARFDSGYSHEQLFFLKEELRELFAKHGLENIEMNFQGFFTKPFAQVVIEPQLVSVPLSQCAVFLDRFLDRHMPEPLRFLSWDIIVRAKFPGATA